MKRSKHANKATSCLAALIFLLIFTTCSGDSGSFGIPTGVSATSGTMIDRVQVTWNNVSGATRYYVTRSLVSGGTFNSVGSVTTETYNDYNVSARTNYFYKIEAWSIENGYSGVSTETTGSLRDIVSLAAPGGVNATDTGTTITVSWNSVTDATEYFLYRSLNSGGTYSFITRTTLLTYNDAVSPGAQYYYKVKAWSPTQYSLYSTFDSGETTAALSPCDTIAVASVYGDRIDVSWNDPNAPAADSYEVYRATTSDGNYTRIGTPAVTSFTDNDSIALPADPGITYYYKIKAISASGDSYLSSAASGIRTTPLDVPTSLSATDGEISHATYIALTWGTVTGADEYEIINSPDGTTWSAPTTIGTNSYNDTTPATDATAYYQVRAHDSTNDVYSPWSAVESGHRPGTSAILKAPSSVFATDSTYNDKIVITWNAVANADRYTVYRATLAAGPYTDISGEISSLSYEDTGLSQGQTYFYRVRAVSTTLTLESSDSANDQGATFTDLATPANLDAGNTLPDRIPVEWDASVGATKYFLYRSNDNFATINEEIAATTGITYDDFNIPAGDTTTYQYRVKAWSETKGYSSASLSDSGQKIDLTIPLFTTLSTDDGASDGAYTDRIFVEWGSVSGATRYYIFRSTTPGGTYSEIGSTTTLTYEDTDTTLIPGATYYYRIKSWSDGFGYSNPMVTQASGYIITTLDAPPGWNGGAADGTDTADVDVTWQTIAWTGHNTSGTRGYYVYRGTSSTGPFTYLTYVDDSLLTYADTSATPGVRYWYTVKAYHNDPSEVYSEEIAADDGFKKLVNPSAVATQGTVLNGTTNNKTTIRVSWSPVDGATRYLVYVSEDGATGSYAPEALTTTNPYYDFNADPGKLYHFKVQAQNNVDLGPNWANASSDYALATPAEGFLQLTPVTGIAATKGTSTNGSGTPTTVIRITWNNKIEADDYDVLADTGSGYASIGITTNSFLEYNTAIAGTLYNFKVIARTSEGTNSYSDQTSTTPAEGFLQFSPVTNIQTSRVSTVTTITWNEVSGADRYDIYYDANSGGAFGNSVATGVSGLLTTYDYTPGGPYYYKVVARKNGFPGTEASSLTDTTAGGPDF